MDNTPTYLHNIVVQYKGDATAQTDCQNALNTCYYGYTV